jgi:hypothetical protein
MLLSVNSTPTDDDDSTAPKRKRKKKPFILCSYAFFHPSIHPQPTTPDASRYLFMSQRKRERGSI